MNIKPMLAMCNSGRRGEALSLFNCGKRNVSDSVLRAGVTDHGHGSLRGGSHRGREARGGWVKKKKGRHVWPGERSEPIFPRVSYQIT